MKLILACIICQHILDITFIYFKEFIMINICFCIVAFMFIFKSTSQEQEGCEPPNILINGSLEFTGKRNKYGKYAEGVEVNYICGDGYSLRYGNETTRICKGGKWSGISDYCVMTRPITCSPPDPFPNGYYDVPYRFNSEFQPGDTVIPKCDKDFILIGSVYLKCGRDGKWFPKRKTRFCSPQSYNKANNNDVLSTTTSCLVLTNISHAKARLFFGKQQANDVSSDSVLEINCMDGYRDTKIPCAPSYIHCENGTWRGELPNCVKVMNCLPPSDIPHGAVIRSFYNDGYPISSEISYTCEDHYTMERSGPTQFKCGESGCWTPNMMLLTCRPPNHFNYGLPYDDEDVRVSTTEVLMCVVLAVISISLIILAVCFMNTCRQRYHNYHHGRRIFRDASSLLHPSDPASIHSIRRGGNIFSFGSSADEHYLPSYEEVMQQDALAAAIARENSATVRNNVENTNAAVGITNPSQQNNYTSFSPYGIRMLICSGNIPQHLLNPSNNQIQRNSSNNNNNSREIGRAVSMDVANTSGPSNFEQTLNNASSQEIRGSLGSFETNSTTNSEGFPLLPDHDNGDTCSGGLDK